MRCPGCAHENPAGSKFCLECGGALALACGACGTELPAGAKFCNECGTATGVSSSQPQPPARDPRDYTPRHLADKILQSKSALEGERKLVTVLFADVKGSLELAEQLDAEAWHRILDRFFQILADGVHRFEGTINQYTGDGIMALFGAPIAHEDHAQRACYAALHLRGSLRSYADELRRDHGVSFATRIGINSGEVVVGKIGDDLRMDYTAQGHSVGLAQRMEELAEPGSVFLTAHTAALVEGYFALRSLGAFDLRGSSERLEVHELEGVGSVRTRLDRSRARGFSRFVGRVAELATLESALERSREGHGQVVGVVADAGVGKSRLCAEFVESCRARGITVYEAHCPAHGKTVPLLPVYELLRAVFGITEADRDQAAREKIAGRLLLLDREFDADLPLVWDFLGVPDPARPAPETDETTRQHQLHAFVRRLVRVRSEREPAIVFFDDLHWIDPASDAYLAQLVGIVGETRTLVLGNFRPEYHAPWMQRSHYQQLPLAPLGADDIRALASDLLGADESVADLPETIAARTGGNPFFTEEVVQSLVESGHLEGERGHYRQARPLGSIRVPTSVQSVLAARIDRLGSTEKRVLQTAAVIGKEFTGSILRRVSDCTDEEVRSALVSLQDAEFVYERALFPEVEYAFKHPLTQEVAYHSQLESRRRPLHAAVAREIEARDPDKADDRAAILAYHWDAADDIRSAAHWHRRAANRVGVVRLDEAIHHWQRVRDLVGRLPDDASKLARSAEAHAQLLWFESRRVEFDPELGQRLFEECQELAQRSGDPAALAFAHSSCAHYLLYHGEERAGVEMAAVAVREADELGDPDLRVAARFAAAFGSYFQGRFEDAARLAAEAVDAAGDNLGLGHQMLGFSPTVIFRGLRGASLAYLGRREESAREFDQLFDAGHRSYAYSFNTARCFSVVYHWLEGDFRAGHAQVSQAIEGLREMATFASEVLTLYHLGMSFALQGQWREARSALSRSLQTARGRRAFLQMEAETLAWLARAEAEAGELERARELLAEADAAARRIGSRAHAPIAHHTAARILWLERGGEAADEAEREIARGFESARAIGARLYEPFLHRELAALHGARGDEPARRRELERARELFLELDATPNAERTERELAG